MATTRMDLLPATCQISKLRREQVTALHAVGHDILTYCPQASSTAKSAARFTTTAPAGRAPSPPPRAHAARSDSHLRPSIIRPNPCRLHARPQAPSLQALRHPIPALTNPRAARAIPARPSSRRSHGPRLRAGATPPASEPAASAVNRAAGPGHGSRRSGACSACRPCSPAMRLQTRRGDLRQCTRPPCRSSGPLER